MTVRWGHFSDLHFQFKNFNTQLLRNSLLKTLGDDQLKFDYIFITGDIFNKYNYDKDTTKFIKDIAETTNCDEKDIVICPGNHDAKRGMFRKNNLDQIITLINNNNGELSIPEDYKDPLITSIFKDFKSKCKEITGEEQQEQTHYVVDCGKIKLYVLNTSIFAGQTYPEQNPSEEELRKEDTCLYICDKELYELNNMKKNIHEDKQSINIVLAHHGVECFVESEQKKLKNFLDSLDIDLYLCGHVHKNVLNRLSNTKYSIPQVSCGGLFDDTYNEPSFIVGEYDELNFEVKLTNYEYIKGNNSWAISNTAPKPYEKGIFDYTIKRLEDLSEGDKIKNVKKIGKIDYPFKLKGYTLLGGRGSEGIKYYWEKEDRVVESLTFNKRLNTDDVTDDILKVSAYTSSISFGCILKTNLSQCKFCETGTLDFKGYLTAEEIALQNIFMAEYDSDCPSYPKVRENRREFAYMGQGEPGHAYHLIRKAILLTDCAMDEIHQKVERHIISTCGITGFIPILISDIKNKVYTNKVTVHFSLNSIEEERDFLMPVNKEHNYNDFLKECVKLYEVTKEKIGVGILIFNNFSLNGQSDKTYTLTIDKLNSILDKLNVDVFKIDLCDYNNTCLGSQSQVSNEYANELLDIVKKRGFEGKLFSSFGTDNASGCGMLKSSINNINEPGNKTKGHYQNAVNLLLQAKKKLSL